MPKASAASISMPISLDLMRARSCAPCTMKRPARTGLRPARLCATQSVSATVSIESAAAAALPAASAASLRSAASSGGSGNGSPPAIGRYRPRTRRKRRSPGSPLEKSPVGGRSADRKRGGRQWSCPPFTTFGETAGNGYVAHDPEKLVLDVIGDGHRFSDKIMRNRKLE